MILLECRIIWVFGKKLVTVGNNSNTIGKIYEEQEPVELAHGKQH